MSKEEAVASCRKLSLVEKAFRNLKTVWLQVRPVYHKTDDRILAHVFICMLAYYLQWHMQRRLVSLFAIDGTGKDRKWSFSLVMASLRQISLNPVRMGKVQFEQLTVPIFYFSGKIKAEYLSLFCNIYFGNRLSNGT